MLSLVLVMNGTERLSSYEMIFEVLLNLLYLGEAEIRSRHQGKKGRNRSCGASGHHDG